MATENSPPQIRIILTVAFSSVVILAALNAVFRSYYLMMTEEVEHEHLSKPEELQKLREGERKNLSTVPLPITQAMQELSSRGRTNYAAYVGQADITPEASNDLGPMVGWVRAPNQAVVDAINAAAANAPAGGTGGAADGGAPLAASSDAGVTTATATPDGGQAAAPVPPKPLPPKKGAPARGAGAH
jgi:hypothetical protein